MSDLLTQHLGRCLSAQQVASFLDVDITTIYRNYLDLGGVKIGSTYKFFEQNLIQALKPVQVRKLPDLEPSPAPEPRKCRPKSEQKPVRQKRQTSNPHGLL